MALIKGILASLDDPLLGIVPTIVPFQYNPTQVTRVFGTEGGAGEAASGSAGSALSAARPAPEDYTVNLELDATDGLEKGGPLTTTLGISPRLAAIEMLMQPVGSSLLGELAGAVTGGLIGGGKATIPAGRLPLVFFIWGPARITPITSSAASETDRARNLEVIPASAQRRRTSRPLPPGRWTSSSTTSGLVAVTTATALSTSCASPTICTDSPSSARTPLRNIR